MPQRTHHLSKRSPVGLSRSLRRKTSAAELCSMQRVADSPVTGCCDRAHSTPPKAAFKYDVSLNGARYKHTIRIIDLNPGNGDSLVTCSIRLVSLEDKPQYDAISYCWGGQTP